jgi:hypothetical protein
LSREGYDSDLFPLEADKTTPAIEFCVMPGFFFGHSSPSVSGRTPSPCEIFEIEFDTCKALYEIQHDAAIIAQHDAVIVAQQGLRASLTTPTASGYHRYVHGIFPPSSRRRLAL